MKIKIPLLCILSVLILIISFYSPVVFASKNTDNQEYVEVKINNSIYGSIKQDIRYLTVVKVKETKQILLEYDKAIEENNFDRISECESWLKENGILDDKQLIILSLLKRYQGSSGTTSNLYYSESNCKFSAIGNGFMVFPLEKQIIDWIQEQAENQENPIAGFVIMLLLLVLFYLPVMFVTHLIPFRIGMSQSQVTLNSGTMKIGDQDIIPPVKVNLTLFTGLTISTPHLSGDNKSGDGNNGGFLFVYGYAGKVEEVDM